MVERWLASLLRQCISHCFEGGKIKKLFCRDFPAGLVVTNLPSDAGEAGLTPGWKTKTPHGLRQQCPWSATTEPTMEQPVVHDEQPVHWKIPWATAKTQWSQKKRKRHCFVHSACEWYCASEHSIFWKSTWYYDYLTSFFLVGYHLWQTD